MHYFRWFLTVLAFFTIQSYAYMPEPSALSPLSFNPTANPTFNNTPNYYNEVNPTITCTATSLSYAVAIALRDYMVPWIDKMKNMLTASNYELFKTIINNFLWQYKYVIVGNTIAGSYITTTVLLLSDYYFFMNSDRWSQWRNEHSFEQLCSTPQQQLTKELLIAINERHCNNANPTDINHPLISFISDMNNEIYRINRYITVANVQKKLHLMRFFPINDNKIKKAEQLLTRAHFIKHLFLSWLAEYNLNNK